MLWNAGNITYYVAYVSRKGFEQDKFWNNTCQAVQVINGSGWAIGANWMYAEQCTGEREFYNVSEDPYQIYNNINATDASLLSKLSVLTYMLGSCAGKNCSDMDFILNTELVSMNNSSDLYHQQRLRCFNPPDLPGQLSKSVDDSIWELVEEDKAYCHTVITNGFPYAEYY